MAATLIHSKKRTWQDWEGKVAVMPDGLWELFCLKTSDARYEEWAIKFYLTWAGTPPEPSQIKQRRAAAKLTQAAAAALVSVAERTWQDWELNNAKMHPGFWELFCYKTSGSSGVVDERGPSNEQLPTEDDDRQGPAAGEPITGNTMVETTQKYLPNGWTAEACSTDEPELVALTSPGAVTGYITVDFKRRIFATGIGRPRFAAIEGHTYKGRGWEQRLVEAAVQHLKDVLA